MKMQPECFKCFFQQADRFLKYLRVSKLRRFKILKQLGNYLFSIERYDRAPAFYASTMYKILYEAVGVKDPYKKVKKEYNQLILRMYPELLKLIKDSRIPLYSALKLSAIGNTIDFGVETSLDIKRDIQNFEKIGFKKDDFKIFQKLLKKSVKIMLIADNSGEIIFDKLLLEIINSSDKYKIIIGVRGAPVINDVTIEDLKYIQFSNNIKVVSNGNAFVGTVLDECSEEFLKEFKESDIIISKGQANFESLNECKSKNIFFLFKAKCEPVANFLGVEQGSLIFSYNRSS